MNKWKKVGLTALSASLVSATAYAGALDVSGAASITYHSSDDAAAGNAYSHNKDISFSGGGDLDNGMKVSVYYELDQGNNVFDDYNLKLGMCDMVTLSFSGNSSS